MSERVCGWLLSHRDKHNCGCQCKKPHEHKGYHRCELDLAAAADLPVQGEQP
jgi:hypothetical protein